MNEGKVGSLVWVQMKDGEWWPGRVLSLDEISASDHSYLASTSKIPVMLLGRNHCSVEWHELENSRRKKSFRCDDFDDFIQEVESSQVFVCTKRVKYAHQGDAILHALQHGEREERTILKRPGAKKQESGENSNIQNGSWTAPAIMNGESSVRSRKRMQNMRKLLMANATCEEESRWYEYKSSEQSPLDVSKLSHSPWEGSHLEDYESLSFSSPSTGHPNILRTMLMDVEVKVLANHRREDVPLVSLMSRLNGKAIIGHPIDTEALDDTSDVFLVKKGEFHQRLEKEENNRMNQLAWRTFKRTPVCYISNLNACPSEGEETEETCKTFGGSNVRRRKDSPPTDETFCKSQKLAAFPNNEVRKLFGIGKKDGQQGQKGCVKHRATCVPVNCIFSNLLLAVGKE